jgi:lipooligosaccharide transport system permease protein
LELSGRGVIRVWQRNFDIYIKFILNRLLTSALYPILFLFSIGYGVGYYIGEVEGIPYVNFIAPSLIVSAIMFASSFSTTYGTYIRMRYQKTFSAIIATPVSVDEVIVGEIFWGVTRGVIDGMIIYLVTLAFKLLSFPETLVFIPLFPLFGLVFSLLGILITSLIKNIEQFEYYFNCFISLMFLFSGTFFPISRLPLIFQKLSFLLPLTHATKIARAISLGKISSELLYNFFFLAGLIPSVFLLALLLMRRRIIEYI